MPNPTHCPNLECINAYRPSAPWFTRHGRYQTVAHGVIQRYRCTRCGTTMSEQTESLHYYAKRHVPYRAVWESLTSGASQRAIADRYRLSPQAVHNAVIRLGRQAMASQALLLQEMSPVHSIVLDGLRSFVTSQDYPCDLSMCIEAVGETILSIEHTVLHRGGRKREYQKRRMDRKMESWQPRPGRYTAAITLLLKEMWDCIRPQSDGSPAVLHSDRHWLYSSLIKRNRVCQHQSLAQLFVHRQTSSHQPRTRSNPLFPANYVDLLLRHRMKEHTRETIAFGRNAVSQMHRLWVFAWDHNARKPHRVRHPERGVHAAQAVAGSMEVKAISRQLFVRRIDLWGASIPASLRAVWMQKTETPPVRWRSGQRGTNVRLPAFAIRDLNRADQQAC